MSAAYGRNDPCPCGSGKKIKKCHTELAGRNRAAMMLQARIIKIYQAHLDFFRRQPDYTPPPNPYSGWSRENFRLHGCPYVCENGLPACKYETAGNGFCDSPGCGVGALESSLAGNMGELVELSSQGFDPASDDYRRPSIPS